MSNTFEKFPSHEWLAAVLAFPPSYQSPIISYESEITVTNHYSTITAESDEDAA